MSVVLERSPASSIWRYPSFVILLFSSLFLNVGQKVYEFTLPLLMYEFTQSSVTMSSMRTAELLPNLLIGMFVGVLVDRLNKVKWARSMILLQTIVLLSMVVLDRLHIHALPFYYMAGFLLMMFNYGYFNAQVSLTKFSVPTAMLTSANATFSFVETLISVLGPAITGVVLLLSRISDGLFLTAVAYILCYLLLNFFRVPAIGTEPTPNPTPAAPVQPFWQSLAEGWVALRNNRDLWVTTLFVIFLNSTSMVVSTTVIFYAKDVMRLDSVALGVVLSIAGLGGLAGSMVISRMRRKFTLGTLFGASIVTWVIGYTLVFLAQSSVVLAIALFINGFSFTVYSIAAYTLRHETTPMHLIGRISGLTGTLWRLGMPLTVYLSGYMCIWWGAKSVFLCAAIANVVIFAVYLRSKMWKVGPLRA